MFLVTGGTGFIGSAVVRGLVEAGKRVVVFDRVRSMERLAGLEQHIEVVGGDIADLAALNRLVHAFKVTDIIHLAFHVGINELEHDPGQGVDANCTGFINILEAARMAGVKKVVWTSSAAVYGKQELYEGMPAGEDDRFDPQNAYGIFKVFCESIGAHYHSKLGVNNISLRPTNVFGSGRWFRGAATYTHDLFHGPVQGQPVLLEGGDQLIDWLYVKDLVNAILLATLSDRLQQRTFNICGHRATIGEAAALVKKLRSHADIGVRPGSRSLRTPCLDSRRARDDLRYHPLFSLEEAFADCLAELESAHARQS
jgi:UDP-glucose 4-epimerase